MSRPAGEDLAAESELHGLRVFLVGTPRRRVRRDLETRLRNLIESAGREAERDLGPRPLPGAMHHALMALLDWLPEVDGAKSGAPMGALLIFESDHDVAFAHVGGTEPGVYLNDRPLEVTWTTLAGPRGREARGFSLYARPSLSVRLEWYGARESEGARVEAEWRGRTLGPREFHPPRLAIVERSRGNASDAQSLDIPTSAGGEGEPQPGCAREEGEGATAVDPELETAERFAASARSGGFFKWLDWIVERRHESEATPGSPDDAGAGLVTEPPSAAYPPGVAITAAIGAEIGGEPAGPGRATPEVAAAVEVKIEAAAEARSPAPSLSPAEVVPPPAAAGDAGARAAGHSAAALPDPTLFEAQESRPAAVPRAPRRPAWPRPSELRPRHAPGKRLALLAPLVVLLFLGGWLLGRVQTSTRGKTATSPAVVRMLRAIGLAGARFDLGVTSQPAGAWIAVDGKDLARRTPASLELTPGEHSVALTLPDYGKATFKVRGERGERTALDAPLWGSLVIRAPDGSRPIQVSVDGSPRGYAPTTVADLPPGGHEVEFTSPGTSPWGQTVRIKVREESEIIARPFDSPATGLIEVRASLVEDEGAQSLKGATVWVDGQKRGATPLALELQDGPHSFRVEYRGEQPPVQVIDLPGGNQRFATFQLGVGVDQPRLALLSSPGPMPRDRPALVSVALEGVGADEVRELWLHVRTPEAQWRRYPMVQLEASGALVGVAVFPMVMLDAGGRAAYYVSAGSTTGDEYYTELQSVVETGPSRPRRVTTPSTSTSTP